MPGSATKLMSCSTAVRGVSSSRATASSDASETSSAPGYEKSTWLKRSSAGPGGIGRAFGLSLIIGSRSSTSKSRSKLTIADM